MRLCAFMSLLFISFSSSAASGWTSYGKVLELVPTIHQRFKVNIEVEDNPAACKQKQWFYQDYSISGAREMYFALLEAVASSRPVRVYVTGRCNLNEYSEISEAGIRAN